MEPRSSRFHTSLHRPRFIMGIERGAFGALVLVGVCMMVFRLYWAMALMPLGWVLARWQSKKDAQFLAILGRYLMEEHAFDATPRPSDTLDRPVGWGRGLRA